jgi:hypothetical protein
MVMVVHTCHPGYTRVGRKIIVQDQSQSKSETVSERKNKTKTKEKIQSTITSNPIISKQKKIKKLQRK